ncbi:MAG: Protein MraZ [Candidatus Daviesbacteria bacterium GW2011_GWA2_38_24]|uniref:Transcriptional regulator MraZ n=1 Tax=Candidatus Daviesbacteria bacterium GW2011_GWA2_38_24 TaxID=1618422 RepID=A0A0G0M0K2_9BACT|nr:MAG: Protein MraZ [Candidatus Daviesbacteria bacterium GW2011_GWA2_38_24]KKQ80532.1 MAG: Protein MraZ [Candidatus Daviesbacteria bacterium GW2011_GWA1_38_7]OGE23319.1 MAG: hypothetical protein A2688_04420 [Candidatus Daviesbacteria bacterium RIFCSPHIGHO2_01_FULL_38_8]
MYLGSYITDFSGKNRLMLPKKFRKELGEEARFYIILGKDGEIWGFDKDNWQKLSDTILEKPLSSIEGRIGRRAFFSRADECFLDRQGRFVLPQEFVDQGNLKDKVAIIGAGDHFEIWDSQKWQEVLEGAKI